jgi:phospholipase C
MRFAFKVLLLALGIVPLTAHAQILNFKHVVVIFQENRTPDNLFQGLCAPPYGACAVPPTPMAPYNIQTSHWKTKTGTIQPGPVALADSYDLGHAHKSFNVMCDVVAGNPPTCRMDGAAAVSCNPKPGTTCPPNAPLKYVSNTNGILNPYLTLATQYGWANYMFQTNQGPSFPAHQFIFGGTSAPSRTDDLNGIFSSENMKGQGLGGAGCTATTTTRVELISPNLSPPPYGVENSSIFPCFEHLTMADLVKDWKYYAAGTGSIWLAPNSIDHICLASKGACTGWGTHVEPINPSQVLTDLGNCQLHELTWITPTAKNSDHPLSNDGGGPSWVASIVNAIGNSPCADQVGHKSLSYWEDTAIFITWDDWGGWYDHEPPTILSGVQGDYQYGFRVPMIVVSAYTPQGFVDNQRHDFGSILRFVEHNFANLGLREGELGFADSRATTDLTEFFNLLRSPRPFTTIAAPKNADFFIHDTRPPEPPDND